MANGASKLAIFTVLLFAVWAPVGENTASLQPAKISGATNAFSQ
jgi:hypothetical protein